MLLELVIAKTLALVDAFLEVFATVSENSGTTIGLGNCALAINADVVTITDCGRSLIDELTLLISSTLLSAAVVFQGIAPALFAERP